MSSSASKMAPKASDFDYTLPPEMIAQVPLDRRDESRLMVVDRATGLFEHRRFNELPDLLGGGALLAINDTRVVPARFFLRRDTGGRIEALFVRQQQAGLWQVMLRGAGRCRAAQRLEIVGAPQHRVQLLRDLGGGHWELAVDPPAPAAELLELIGRTPLPPYIHRSGGDDAPDRRRYQTVYAARPGAVAAPTAGLHFTPALLEELRRRGIEQARLTLHVGPGTFLPVKVENLCEHRMHAEWFDLPGDAAAQLNAARRAGRPVVAVGTTSVRVIESVARQVSAAVGPTAARSGAAPGARSASGSGAGPDSSGQHDAAMESGGGGVLPASPTAHGVFAAGRPGEFPPISGWTDLFLYPPADFLAADALITNFHLPRSTLLMLVSAFASPGRTDGIELIRRAYAEAIAQRYRFYSYGDAMLIR